MQKIELSEDTVKLILQKYKTGNNITNIVTSLSLSRRVVERAIQDAGYMVLTKSDLIKQAIPELSNKDFLTKKYFVEGMSISELAQSLGTNEQVIKTAFKKLNIKAKSTTASRVNRFASTFPSLSDKLKLEQLYLKDKKSPTAISIELGCSSSAVTTALKRFKIKRRNHGDSLRKSTPAERINAKIARNLRSRFWIALMGKSKMVSAVNDLGCSIKDLKDKFSRLFYANSDGCAMTWDNYGEWEIDHVVPLSNFDLSDKEQQKKACHFSNLQPLWKNHNRKKSDKISSLHRATMYIVTGPSGAGKTWVCDQLENVNYISYDTTPKEQHYYYMNKAAKNNQTIIYDPFRKVNTLFNRYKDEFDIKVVFIEESEIVLLDRLKNRGSQTTIDKIRNGIKHSFRNRKNASFIGTSSEVLEYLKNELMRQAIRPIHLERVTSPENATTLQSPEDRVQIYDVK